MKNHSIVVCKSTFLDEALKMHLSCSEAERLWVNLDKLSVESSPSKISNAFYFLDAWVVILALAWFMGDRYMLYGTSALLPISIGGWKESGIGREGGIAEGLNDYCELKAISYGK